MAPEESVLDRMKRYIVEILTERTSLPQKKRPIEEARLKHQLELKFGNGDIESTMAEAIEYLEHGRHRIIRDIQGRLELNQSWKE